MAKGSFMKGFIFGVVIYIVMFFLIGTICKDNETEGFCNYQDGKFDASDLARYPSVLFIDVDTSLIGGDIGAGMWVLILNAIFYGILGGLFLRGK